MAKKVMVILANGDPDVLRSGLEFSYNATSKEWFEDIKIILFGPSEETILNDPDCLERANDIMGLQKDVTACKWVSDNSGVSTQLHETGFKVESVGVLVSSAINDDYVPMVW